MQNKILTFKEFVNMENSYNNPKDLIKLFVLCHMAMHQTSFFILLMAFYKFSNKTQQKYQYHMFVLIAQKLIKKIDVVLGGNK